jgi:hypothetical protein
MKKQTLFLLLVNFMGISATGDLYINECLEIIHPFSSSLEKKEFITREMETLQRLIKERKSFLAVLQQEEFLIKQVFPGSETHQIIKERLRATVEVLTLLNQRIITFETILETL